MEVFLAVFGLCCILWLHWSLSSEYSICALHCTCFLVMQLQQRFFRHVGSDFRLQCITNCSVFTVHEVTYFYRIRFHSEKQKLFNMFSVSLLNMYQIKYAFGLDCIWMFDFINWCLNCWRDFELRLGQNSNYFCHFVLCIFCKVAFSVPMTIKWKYNKLWKTLKMLSAWCSKYWAKI